MNPKPRRPNLPKPNLAKLNLAKLNPANLPKPSLRKPSLRKPRLRKPDLRNADLDKVLRLVGFRYATAALVLVAVAALYGAASFSRPGEAAEPGREGPVASAVLACPGHEGARLAVQSLPGGETGGEAAMTAAGSGAELGTMSAPGQGWDDEVKAGTDAYTLRATGPMAAGLTAEQTTHRAGGAGRGLAGTRCAVPGTDLWFMGPGPDSADELVLYLTNVDARPASVDLTALSGEGPRDTMDGRGIRVDPRATRVVQIGASADGLGDAVTSAADLALRVRTTGGRVAASLRVRAGAGEGIEWVPQSPDPARTALVPGVPGGDGKRRLLIAVPGEADARIKVEVITADGAYAPQGQELLDAPARTVTQVPLDRALLGKSSAVRLVADRPVLAGFAAERGADIAYGAATAPLSESAPGIVAENQFDSALVLTAPQAAATVRVATVNARGAGAPTEVRIPAGRTVETELTAPPGGVGEDPAYGVVITPVPGSAPVHASRTLSTGSGDEYLFSVLPIVPAPTSVHLPDTADSQTALIP